MRPPLNDLRTMDNISLQRRLALKPFLASHQYVLTEKNLFRLLTLVAFCVVVSLLLFYCDFLPYGTDNNETFSSILHAKNMYLRGIGSAYGLTNETMSPMPGAVPFVYTHQG